MKKTKKAEVKAIIAQPLKHIKWITKTSKIKLNFLSGINRPVSPGHVTKIAPSVEAYGMLAPVICAELDFITGKKELYVLDKQHGMTACSRVNTDIPYIIIPIEDKQELVECLALLNASSKPWCMLDYVTAWSTLVPDYIKLNRYYEIYDFEMSILAGVLSGDSIKSGDSAATKRLKKGEFRIKDEDENVKILNDLTDVLKIIPRMNRYENRYVCSEYVKFRRTTRDYNHDKFLKNLKLNKEKFLLATQEEGRLSDLFYKLKK